MLIDLTINLAAALIGFFIAQAYSKLRQSYSRRIQKRFWFPTNSTKIYIHCGEGHGVLSDMGEVEAVVNLPKAQVLGELMVFLKSYYAEVIVTTDKKSIDWLFPVICLGGPMANSLTMGVGERGLLPLWFLNLPYSKESERVIGSSKRAELFKSEFNENNQMISDVGFVARLKSPENPKQFLYVIAANYGTGNVGVVRHLTSIDKLAQLNRMEEVKCFQAIIRSRMTEGQIIDTTLLHYRSID